MSDFIDRAFTMPTAVFSVLLIVVAFYWLISLVAGLDIFGGFFEGAEGAAEGLFEGAVDGALDGALEGAADGVLESDLDRGQGRGWMRLLGFGEVPVILVLSLITLFGWGFSFGGSTLVSKLASRLAFFAAGGIGVALLVAVTAIGLSLVATMVAITPLRKLMRFAPATERRELVGCAARVTTQRVDERFGQAEEMDISVKTIEIDRRGQDGLICHDNIRADIKVTFFVRINKTKEDVIKVAQAIGCDRASKIEILEQLFAAKFSEALKTVGKQLDFVDLYTKRDDFRDRIIEVIGTDLNGYSLEDAAIDYLEQTPVEQLDPRNILDAQGIRKITELTAIEHIRTNEFENNEKKLITKQNVETAEAVLELERQKADAEAKQRREIDTMQAREEAATTRSIACVSRRKRRSSSSRSIPGRGSPSTRQRCSAPASHRPISTSLAARVCLSIGW